jgi:hypothetical protein
MHVVRSEMLEQDDALACRWGGFPQTNELVLLGELEWAVLVGALLGVHS